MTSETTEFLAEVSGNPRLLDLLRKRRYPHLPTPRGGVMFLISLKRHCPVCHNHEIHRSRRHGMIERFILPFLLLRPFRCADCGGRYVGLFFARLDREKIPGDFDGRED